MGTASYAYNEAKMMDGIKAFREEQKVRPEMAEFVPSLLTIQIKTVLRVVAHHTGEKVSDLISNHSWRCAKMRGIVFTILREEPFSYSLQKLGKAVDDYHHTTVKHALVETKKRCEQDPNFQKLVDSIRQAVHVGLGV